MSAGVSTEGAREVPASVAQVATLADAPIRRRKAWTTLDSLLATRDSVQPDGPWGSYTVAVESTLVEGEQVRFQSVGAAAQTFIVPKLPTGQHHSFPLRFTTTAARVAVQMQVKMAPPAAKPPVEKRAASVAIEAAPAPSLQSEARPVKRTKASVVVAVLGSGF
eukprot:6202418-Prymnesium_polylepis.1